MAEGRLFFPYSLTDPTHSGVLDLVHLENTERAFRLVVPFDVDLTERPLPADISPVIETIEAVHGPSEPASTDGLNRLYETLRKRGMRTPIAAMVKQGLAIIEAQPDMSGYLAYTGAQLALFGLVSSYVADNPDAPYGRTKLFSYRDTGEDNKSAGSRANTYPLSGQAVTLKRLRLDRQYAVEHTQIANGLWNVADSPKEKSALTRNLLIASNQAPNHTIEVRAAVADVDYTVEYDPKNWLGHYPVRSATVSPLNITSSTNRFDYFISPLLHAAGADVLG